MMKAVSISETSVNFNVTTRHYIPEDSKLHSYTFFCEIQLQKLMSFFVVHLSECCGYCLANVRLEVIDGC
jgi:hypothetical protein